MSYSHLLISTLILCSSFGALAKDKLVATPTNSPVKETYLKVKLEGFEFISGVSFKPKLGGTEIDGEVSKEGASYIGKLKASHLKPGKYEFRVKVRTPSGKSAKNGAASVAFVKFEVDPSLEVADPGEEGKKTLAGIDSDRDGVRDDVQRWINENYSNRIEKLALKQYAKSYHYVLTTVDDKARNVIASHKSRDADICIKGTFGLKPGIAQRNKVMAKLINTKDRLRAEKKSDLNFHGQIIDGVEDRMSKCQLEAGENK